MNTDRLIPTNDHLISALAEGRSTPAPRRNWMAWLESFLVPRHRRSMNG